MRIAIRVDASNWIGTGHVVRCATLADALHARGVEVRFLCRELPGDYCDWLASKGHPVFRMCRVERPLPVIDGRGYAGWLGVTLLQDAEEAVSALEQIGPCDWLVVDHYALDASWERALRSDGRRIFIIDDLADRMHDCDLLLDQNIVADAAERYAGKLPQTCRTMIGPRYALLQPAYEFWHRRTKPRSGPVRNFLIFFGGVDADNLTGMALSALKRLKRDDIATDVVIGSRNPHRNIVATLAAAIPGVRLHGSLPSLAPLMADADLALGASGATAWERCCLGLPSLVVTLEANQIPGARRLHELGLIRWLGNVGDVDEDRLAAAMSKVFDQGGPADSSKRCMELVHGQGTDRVVTVLTADASMPLCVREAAATDEELLLYWANDPVVRAQGFAAERIDAETHQRWFRSRLDNRDSCRIYVAESVTEMPVGQVRLERQDGHWQIGYSLDALFRGIGLGGQLLEKALLRFEGEFGGAAVVGRVKEENVQSYRIFQRLGFTPQSCTAGVIEFRRATGPTR